MNDLVCTNKNFFSVAIITKNEEERIANCIKSVAFADEILVVDSMSTDSTVDIAKSLGARVIIEPWRGYSAQKQFAVDNCKYDWVLIIDADERVPSETADVIKNELKKNDKEIVAFQFKRKNYLHGRWIKHCGWYPNKIIRLVNRKKGKFDGEIVHEKWMVNGKIKMLESDILHNSFRNYSEMIAKMENYSSLAAKSLFKNERRSNVFSPIFHGMWMFIKTYFFINYYFLTVKLMLIKKYTYLIHLNIDIYKWIRY